MSSIDERVVQMEFDNDQFEKGIKQSMRSLDEFKKSLKLEDATKNLTTLEKTAGKISLDPLVDAAKAVTNRFSDMGVVAMVGIERLTNAAINAGHRIINDMITPMRTGFAEYETQINAVQTILANTKSKGTTLDQVNAALDELNTYADKTIYNFTQMTKNIGTFTAAGVDLNTSVAAIKGIANLAAVSGSNSEQASRAMYQLSQALASGTVRLQDWNSVNTAGMGGEVFQNALLETARVHGIAVDAMIQKEGSFRESLKKGWLSSEVLLETLKKFTGDLNEAELRSIGYTDAQIASIMELGKMANDAATEVKTFTQLFDTLAEAAQSGWTQSWEILIGDFEEAKKLLTDISDALSGIINKQAASRNALLEQVFGTKAKNPIDKSKWEAFSTGYENAEAFKNKIIEVARAHGIAIDDMIASEGSFEASLENGWLNSDIIREAMGNTEAAAEAQAHTFEAYQNIVAEIWQGNWGNGEERFNRLTEAGWDYAFVQELVNATKFTDGILSWEQLTEEQKNYITTLSAGSTEFQDLVNSMQDSDSAINGLLEGTEELSGREKLIAAFTHIWEILLKVLADIGKVWGIVFPDNRAEFLSGLIDKFYKWVMALEYSSEMGAKVRVVFNGIFSAIAVVVDVVKAVVQGIRNFLDTLPKGDSTVLDFFVKIGLFLGQFRQFLLREGAFNKITEGLTNFLVSVAGFISSLWNDIKNLFSGEGLNFEWLDTLKRWFGKIWDTIKKINFEPFNEFINNAKEFFKNRGFNFEWVGSVKENVSTAFESIGTSFSKWAEEHGLDTSGPLEFISSALSNFWNWLTNLDWGPFEGLKTNLTDFWTWLTTNVSNIGQTIFDGIQNAIDGIISWFKEQGKGEAQSPIEIVKEKLTGFVTWFVELKDTAGAKIEEVRNKVFAGITGAVSYFIDWVTKKREQLGSLFDVTDKIQAFIEWFKTTGKTIKSRATSIKDTIFAGVAAAIDRFVEWKDTKSTELTGLLEQFNPIQAFVDWFTDLASKAGDQVTEVKDTIFGGISNAIELFIQWKDKKRKQLTDLLKNFHPIQNFLDWFNGLANADNISARITEIKDTVFGGIINAINVLADWKRDKTTFLAELLSDFHPIQNFLDWFNGLKDNSAAAIEDVKDTVFGGIINAIDKLVAWKDTTKTNIENLIGTFDPITDFINWFNDTVANVSGDVTSVKDTIFKGVTDAIDAVIAWYNDLSNSDAFAPLIAVRDQLMEFVSWFRGESSESSKSEEKMTIFDVISKHFTDFITWGDTLLSQFGFIENIKTVITDFLNFIKDPFGAIGSAVESMTGRTRSGVVGIVGGKRGGVASAAKGLVTTNSGGGDYNFGDTARYLKASVTGEDTDLTYENTIFYKIQTLFSDFLKWFNSPENNFHPVTYAKEKFQELVDYINNLQWPEVDVEGMRTFFTGIGEGIGGFMAGIASALNEVNIVDTARTVMEDLKSLFSPTENGGISWIEQTRDIIVDSLGPMGTAAGEFIDNFLSGLSNFVGDIQLKDVLGFVVSGLWALSSWALYGGLSAIVNSTDSIAEWFECVTGGNKMVLLYRLGIGLIGLAAACKIFADMGPEKAAAGMEQVKTGLLILLGEEFLGTIFNLLGGPLSIRLGNLGTALIGLAVATQIFADIKAEDMDRAVGAMQSMLGKLSEMALATAGYDFGVKKGSGSLNFSKSAFSFSTGFGLMGAAVAVAIMGWTAERLAEVDPDKLANGERVVNDFGSLLTIMAGIEGLTGFNLGAGLGSMGLAEAISIMASTAQKIHESTFEDKDVWKLIGFATLVTIMAAVVGYVSGKGGTGEERVDLPDGTKKVIKSAQPGIGAAFEALGLAVAVGILAEVATKIHGSSVDGWDLAKVTWLAGIVEVMAILSGKQEGVPSKNIKYGHGEFEVSKVSSGNIGSALKTLGLVGAVKLMASVAGDVHGLNLSFGDVVAVGFFALIVGAFAAMAGGTGESYTEMGKDGKFRTRKGTKFSTGLSVASVLETLALVESVKIMGHVAAELGALSPDAFLRGSVAVGAFAVIVGIFASMASGALGKGMVGVKGTATLARGLSFSGALTTMALALPKIAEAVSTMSNIDWGTWARGVLLMSFVFGEIVLAGWAMGALKVAAKGIIIFAGAVWLIGEATAAVINSLANFATAFVGLYDKLNPDANGDTSLSAFMDFVGAFLTELDTRAYEFGKAGYNIAKNFTLGILTGLREDVSEILKTAFGWKGISDLESMKRYESIYGKSAEERDQALWEYAIWAGWDPDKWISNEITEDYKTYAKNNGYDQWTQERALESYAKADSESLQQQVTEIDDALYQAYLDSLEDPSTARGKYNAYKLVSTYVDPTEVSKSLTDYDYWFDTYGTWLAKAYGMSKEQMYETWVAVSSKFEVPDLPKMGTIGSETDLPEDYKSAATEGMETAVGLADGAMDELLGEWQEYEDQAYADGKQIGSGMVDPYSSGFSGMVEGMTGNMEDDAAMLLAGGLAMVDQYAQTGEKYVADTADWLGGLAEEGATDIIETAETVETAVETAVGNMVNDLHLDNLSIDESAYTAMEQFLQDYFGLNEADIDPAVLQTRIDEYNQAIEEFFSDPASFDFAKYGLNLDLSSLTGAADSLYAYFFDPETGTFKLQEVTSDIFAGIVESANSEFSTLTDMGTTMGESLDEGFTDYFEIESPSKLMQRHGLDIIRGLLNGINLSTLKLYLGMMSIAKNMSNQTRKMAEKMVSAMSEYDDAWKKAGENAIKGFVKGMTENNQDIINSAKKVAQDALQGAKEELGIKSPSREFEKIGMFADKGLANGITKYSHLVELSSTRVAEGSIDSLRATLSNMAGVINGEIDLNPTIRPVLDISNLRASSARISSMFNNRSGYYAMQANGYFNATQALQNAQVDARNSDVVSAINDLNGRIDAQAEALSGLQVVMNTGALVGQLKRPLDRRLGEMAGYRERGI